jgi:proline iminopeptidase
MKTIKRSKFFKKIRKTMKSRKTMKNKRDSYTGFYPSTKPIGSYTMNVSDLHTVAYSTYGNPEGKPVLYVHGGPGAGTSPKSARFFNPELYYIVLVDQRGCGKSKPTAEIRENTTKNLIADFEKIRKQLKIKKWMVFGGSWGSTLSLAYAMTYPNICTELVLRGIFFCSKSELDWGYEPNGSQQINPEGWEFYENSLPHNEKFKGKYIEGYKKCMRGDFGEKKKNECLLAWTVWEDVNSSLVNKPLKDIIANEKKDKAYVSMSPIENHYFSNKCFLPAEFFLKKSNLDKIRHIPMTIVQGKYDMECPYITAYKLHKALPHSRFFTTIAGHTAMDKENIKYLVKATDYYAEIDSKK